MFKTQTVVQTDSETKIIVNSKYFPSKGTASDVGGIISARSKKNTVNDTKIEMHRVTWIRNYPISLEVELDVLQKKITFSPESLGK